MSFDEVIKNIPDEDELLHIANLFKTLGDPTRMKIIFALQKAELCVSHLAQAIEMESSAVSHQLRVLRNTSLVKSRRDGKNVYYSLDDEHVEKIISIAKIHTSHI